MMLHPIKAWRRRREQRRVFVGLVDLDQEFEDIERDERRYQEYLDRRGWCADKGSLDYMKC